MPDHRIKCPVFGLLERDAPIFRFDDTWYYVEGYNRHKIIRCPFCGERLQ